MDDTIYALSTAPGRGAVAIIRVSGSQALTAAKQLTRSELSLDRKARLASIRHPMSGELLDRALVIGFPAQASYTGEAVVEFQVHGGRAVIMAMFDALGAMDGLRMAEAGEFTRRAFEAGRIDLAQVESIAALVDAETEAQRRAALDALDGSVSRRFAEWRAGVLHARALLEACIDFADEEIPADTIAEAQSRLSSLEMALRRELAGSTAARRLVEGATVALVGPPNVGKSSLLNALAKRDVALTSERAGTTRDVIEVRCEISGRLIVLLDMAGIRETDDDLERAGVERARYRAEEADLRIFLSDQDRRADRSFLRDGDIRIGSKSDLSTVDDVDLQVSSVTGEGLEALCAMIVDRLGLGVTNVAMVATARRRSAIERAATHLANADGAPLEIAAEEARLAAEALASVIGEVDVEDVLDDIFVHFCIGK